MNPFTPFSLNIRGKLFVAERPLVMGILNITPDSFFEESRTVSTDMVKSRVELMLSQGVDIIDIGAYSSRPGAKDVSVDEELSRLSVGLTALREIAPEVLVSVDTFRASVAEIAINEFGADIVNDISGGMLDENMFVTIAQLRVPYILMHMRGTPMTMQSLADYDDVTVDVVHELSTSLRRLKSLGVSDIIIDPGFGFGKTINQNYSLLHHLPHIEKSFGLPVLVGISRKSMITSPLGISAEDALNGTTIINTLALTAGASILRVHDVAAARQAIELTSLTFNAS